MARISGVDIPREKRVVVSLTYIHGIGRSVAQTICKDTGIDPSIRVRDLGDDEVARLRSFVDQKVKVEGDLRREVSRTSSARWTLAAIRVYATAGAFRFGVSGPTPTLGLAKVPGRLWPTKSKP